MDSDAGQATRGEVDVLLHLAQPLEALVEHGDELEAEERLQSARARVTEAREDLDTAAITFRTLAVAALIVLTIAPEALVHPSFQMSFAATLGLVALVQIGDREMRTISASGSASASE